MRRPWGGQRRLMRRLLRNPILHIFHSTWWLCSKECLSWTGGKRWETNSRMFFLAANFCMLYLTNYVESWIPRKSVEKCLFYNKSINKAARGVFWYEKTKKIVKLKRKRRKRLHWKFASIENDYIENFGSVKKVTLKICEYRKRHRAGFSPMEKGYFKSSWALKMVTLKTLGA